MLLCCSESDFSLLLTAVVRVRPAFAGEGRYFVWVEEGEAFIIKCDPMTYVVASVFASFCCLGTKFSFSMGRWMVDKLNGVLS